jgi:hypothetical protein
MRLQFSKIGVEKITIVSLMLGLVHLSTAQQVDSTTQMVNFKVTGSVTNNGFSFIPAFSLGKPAAIFNLNINGGKRFSFEPEFRFALQDGRPLVIYFYLALQNHRPKAISTDSGDAFSSGAFSGTGL